MALTLLCVDDERIVLRSLKEQLSRSLGANVIVETADSGEEALEIFEELREAGTVVPLVISDQQMPGLKGHELLAAIHAMAPTTLNVLLTGQANADAVGAAVNRANLYRFIAKPWNEADLLLTVREALRAHEQSREIERQNEALRAAHEASLRFVPHEFLAILGRSRIEDVRYGDFIEREVTILFSDLRGFTTLVESGSLSEAFGFINAYMRLMDEAIHTCGGFISNIEGDAVLALFPGNSVDAVRAGVMAHRALHVYNRERLSRGALPLKMGVGINTGQLLLGTVGSPQRLQCDVVGDAVNLCSRIESLTKHYGVAMLVSGDTRDQLDTETATGLRFVDRVRVKGKSRPVTLYEVLDTLPLERAEVRRSQQAEYLAAWELYRLGKLAEATLHFDKLAQGEFPDGAALVLASRCRHVLASGGIPDDWDGVVAMDSK